MHFYGGQIAFLTEKLGVNFVNTRLKLRLSVKKSVVIFAENFPDVVVQLHQGHF